MDENFVGTVPPPELGPEGCSRPWEQELRDFVRELPAITGAAATALGNDFAKWCLTAEVAKLMASGVTMAKDMLPFVGRGQPPVFVRRPAVARRPKVVGDGGLAECLWRRVAAACRILANTAGSRQAERVAARLGTLVPTEIPGKNGGKFLSMEQWIVVCRNAKQLGQEGLDAVVAMADGIAASWAGSAKSS